MLSFCGHSERNTQDLKTFENRKFEHDIFSIPLNVTLSETRRENEFLKSKFELHDEKSSRGPNDLFDLNDFSNYWSSNYRSFLLRFFL